MLPPLLFDRESDPGQTRNLLADGGDAVSMTAWEAAQELLQWQMRTAERTLSGSYLHPERGLVEAARHLAVTADPARKSGQGHTAGAGVEC